MTDLRDYQERAISDTRNAFRQSKKVILTAPCGAGKTLVALNIVRSALERGKKVGFIVDRLTLLDQTARVMYDAGIDFGIIQGQNELTDYSKQFQICSAQTLAKRGDVNFDFCVIDEAHIMFKHQLEMLKNGNGTYFLGLTATPFTRGLGKYWDKLVTSKSTRQLITDGFLSKYTVYGPSKPDLTGIKLSAGDYNKKDLAKRTDTKKLIGDIIEHWFKLASNRRTIVMAVNVAHAENIALNFKVEGIKAGVIHCYMDRDEVSKKLQMFRDGELQMLSSVDMISRGFDMPQADCLIMARPTKSLNYHLQALGRVLRTAEGKADALILDHAGNIERLGFPCDEFEMILDKGKNKHSKPKEKKEKLPKPCPKCFLMKNPGVRECPKCGHKTEKQANVTTEKGDLKEMQKGRLKHATQPSKSAFYSRLLACANSCGFKDGWAAFKYKEYFGVWPKIKVDRDEQMYNWLMTQHKGKRVAISFGLAENGR